MAKVDGRSKQARIKKWIKEERAFGKKFKISPTQTNTFIKMKLRGYENIAGLDKRAIKHMGYKNSAKMKMIKVRNKDYYSIWRKKR